MCVVDTDASPFPQTSFPQAGSHTFFDPHHTCRLHRRSRRPGPRARSLTLSGVPIQTLQAATHRMSNYLTTLEEKIDTMEKKKK